MVRDEAEELKAPRALVYEAVLRPGRHQQKVPIGKGFAGPLVFQLTLAF
jgi:hypothetical protein